MIENEILTAIGSLGFPIVACIYMAFMHHESEQKRVEDEQRHSDERVAMTEALTKMNTTLDYMLDEIRKEDKSDGN